MNGSGNPVFSILCSELSLTVDPIKNGVDPVKTRLIKRTEIRCFRVIINTTSFLLSNEIYSERGQ
jgi:hypothetical protein